MASILRAAHAQVVVVYMDAHFEAASLLRSELAARGFTVSGWCQVRGAGHAAGGREVQAALRRCACAVLLLGAGFEATCARALAECHMRRERRQLNVFVRVEAAYDPQRTDELEVAGLVGLSLYVDLSAVAAAAAGASGSSVLFRAGGTAAAAALHAPPALAVAMEALVKQLADEGVTPALPPAGLRSKGGGRGRGGDAGGGLGIFVRG
jgi:hypothetical protein